jgi:tRNA U34 5-methylaminomethyl-2-thiouridine-forming methyltransferase MnmC
MNSIVPDIDWLSDMVPVSKRFDDPYFSLDNGLAETKHVFLKGNGLPARFRDGFSIAELGFGTGLNFLTTVLSWREHKCCGTLRFTSFEAFALQPNDMTRALLAFEELQDIANEFAPLWSGLLANGKIILPDVELTLIQGDARSQVPNWNSFADCWYFDGFSPAKNPELWGGDILQSVYDHTHPKGTFATYTAAGFVRQNLQIAGFEVIRIGGFGRKRHMTHGYKRASYAK